jgi:pyridoxamine 5'-phosphate oxidase
MTQNPIEIFGQWFDEAKNCRNINDPTEFCLATADKNAKPSVRVVLLKKFDDRGFCFFTNYTGRKSKELIENPQAGLCFYWNALGKQIRIEGKAERLSAKESDEYFVTRPDESKLGAWASQQSGELESREKFFENIEDVKKIFKGESIPRPDFWGGWLVKPEVIEFWTSEKFRYHKREVFKKALNGQWQKKLLYP